MYLFAQLSTDDPAVLEKIGEKIADGVSEGVKHGLKATSENAPTNWILMFAAISLALLGFVAIIFVVVRFIKALQDLSKAQDERDREHRIHVKEMQTEFNLRARESQAGCHDHSKEIVGMGKEAIASLSTLSGRLEQTASHIDKSSEAVANSVHSIKNVLHEHSLALALAEAQRAKPQPAAGNVFQNFETAQPFQEKAGT